MTTLLDKTVLIAGVVLAAVILVISLGVQQDAHASSPSATVISAATTTTAVSVTTSTRILATTTNPSGVPGSTTFTRVYASICNPSATIVSLGLNNDAPLSATKATTFIGAAAGYNVCYEITDRNLYSGSVVASSTAGAVTVYATEYVQ